MTKNYEIITDSVEVLCLHDTLLERVTITNKGVYYYKTKGVCYYKTKRMPIIANLITITDVKEVLYNEVSYDVIRIITKDNKCITVSRYGDIKL